MGTHIGDIMIWIWMGDRQYSSRVLNKKLYADREGGRNVETPLFLHIDNAQCTVYARMLKWFMKYSVMTGMRNIPANVIDLK